MVAEAVAVIATEVAIGVVEDREAEIVEETARIQETMVEGKHIFEIVAKITNIDYYCRKPDRRDNLKVERRDGSKGIKKGGGGGNPRKITLEQLRRDKRGGGAV